MNRNEIIYVKFRVKTHYFMCMISYNASNVKCQFLFDQCFSLFVCFMFGFFFIWKDSQFNRLDNLEEVIRLAAMERSMEKKRM